MKSIVFTVTNDLSQDQRMNRICSSLSAAGYQVVLVGRLMPKSLPLETMSFRRQRLACFFKKGKLFYLEYNLRLLLFLFSHKFDVFGAVDLDTIVPCTLAAKRHKGKLVYDAHEYFTEMEEVVHRPIVKRIWKMVERWAMPKINLGYTVSNGYAQLFQAEYKIEFGVIRNATVLKPLEEVQRKNYILYQGAVNFGRGLFELIDAIKIARKPLVICGVGDALVALQEKVDADGLSQWVTFRGFLQPNLLKTVTAEAYLGITVFENAGLSHIYSLANRFFDYMHAAVPQIAMQYPEYEAFCAEYKVAHLIPNHSAESIAQAIELLYQNQDYYQSLVTRCKEARQKNNWQLEEQKLISFYSRLWL